MSSGPGIPRLAATTPARDWARGRLTGRLDWRAIIAENEMPQPLAELAIQVIRRSRLWRLEKADLARELAAHFTDGLRADRTAAELAAEFGDPRTAARLVRRAKRRNRHWSYRAFLHTCHGLGAVLLAAALTYGILAWRFFSGEPSVSRNFTAEYNETIEEIPEADRAWDLYLETYALAERPPKSLEKHWPDIAPEHPRYADALAFLESQTNVIEILHRAAARPHLGAPLSDAADPRIVAADNERNPGPGLDAQAPSPNPMLISVLLPELGHFRAMARLLTLDAHVAARARESARVERDVVTMLGVAQHAAERPTLISQLVGLAIHALAVKTTAEIVHHHPDLLADRQLRALAHRHAAFMDGDIRVDLTSERWFFEDIVQRIYTDDGNGNGHLTAAGLRELTSMASWGESFGSASGPLGPIAAAVVADRADMTALHQKLMTGLEREAALDMWEKDESPAVETQIETLAADPIQRIRYLPIVLLTPAVSKAAQAAQYNLQHRDALLAGIALELYRRDHGAYPESLGALTPRYLPAQPLDRFTGSPLGYAATKGEPRLWSVGADRNDDGGTPPTDARGDEFRWIPAARAAQSEQADPGRFDGDWVLWPAVYQPIRVEDE